MKCFSESEPEHSSLLSCVSVMDEFVIIKKAVNSENPRKNSMSWLRRAHRGKKYCLTLQTTGVTREPSNCQNVLKLSRISFIWQEFDLSFK